MVSIGVLVLFLAGAGSYEALSSLTAIGTREPGDLTISILKKLKDTGVSISVDDFGTGYSSLNYIKKLPVDNLKIDMSFVRDVAKDPDAASIITAITSLARSLSLKTIAEGVETEERRNILHLLRCDMGQGFYFSPAVPAAEYEKLLG
jgi:EAL domain-containing protein (putative c-di-GMP-specific phosphodiesterase class I)